MTLANVERFLRTYWNPLLWHHRLSSSNVAVVRSFSLQTFFLPNNNKLKKDGVASRIRSGIFEVIVLKKNDFQPNQSRLWNMSEENVCNVQKLCHQFWRQLCGNCLSSQTYVELFLYPSLLVGSFFLGYQPVNLCCHLPCCVMLQRL